MGNREGCLATAWAADEDQTEHHLRIALPDMRQSLHVGPASESGSCAHIGTAGLSLSPTTAVHRLYKGMVACGWHGFNSATCVAVSRRPQTIVLGTPTRFCVSSPTHHKPRVLTLMAARRRNSVKCRSVRQAGSYYWAQSCFGLLFRLNRI